MPTLSVLGCVSCRAGGPQLTGGRETRLLVFEPRPAFRQEGVARMVFWISRQVQQPALQRFVVVGSGGIGAVSLASGHIGGGFYCIGARLGNGSGSALTADSLQVGQAMYLRDRFTATGGGAGVSVDLTGTRVGGHSSWIWTALSM
jgi:hypothetical protein